MLTMNNTNLPHPNLTVQAPSWDHFMDDPTATMNADSLLFALSRYLPSNGANNDTEADDYDIPVDAFSCDNFRMYEFKVRKCARARSHDWTECPFAHPGEKARRRDPLKYRYTGSPCPEYRKGTCKSGDNCEYSHGVFECWLHPSRYRTQPCKDGTHCRRRVCFFAHTPDQIRLDNSSTRHSYDSVSAQSDSPPMSPLGLNELAIQMGKMKMGMGMGSMSVSPPGWGFGYGSPHGFFSTPSTPTKVSTRPGFGNAGFDAFEESFEEEPVMERVESGRVLRAQMYAKLSRENSLGRVDHVANGNRSGMNWIMG